jgi:hypothetical protein
VPQGVLNSQISDYLMQPGNVLGLLSLAPECPQSFVGQRILVLENLDYFILARVTDVIERFPEEPSDCEYGGQQKQGTEEFILTQKQCAGKIGAHPNQKNLCSSREHAIHHDASRAVK